MVAVMLLLVFQMRKSCLVTHDESLMMSHDESLMSWRKLPDELE